MSEPTSNENYEDSSDSSDSLGDESIDDGEVLEANLIRVDEPETDAIFEPSVPERPRILSSSSSSNSSVDSFTLPTLSTQFNRMGMDPGSGSAQAANEVISGEAISGEVISGEPLNESSNSSSDTFFSFGGSDEHQTIMNYVQQMVQETFDHSTDSETEDDNPAEYKVL